MYSNFSRLVSIGATGEVYQSPIKIFLLHNFFMISFELLSLIVNRKNIFSLSINFLGKINCVSFNFS